MDKRLSKAARDAILSDSTLYKKVADKLKVKPASLPPIINRNGDNINRYEVVEMIANYMGKTPSDIQEEVQTVPVG
jgi:hypothetical protein